MSRERKITKKGDVFKPTEAMWDYLNTAVTLLTTSPTIVGDNCDVSRMSWYRWKKDPAFMNWFWTEYKLARQRVIPDLDRIAMKYAERGEFEFWKAMNQKVGELPMDGAKVDVNLQVNNLIQEQRDKYDI